MDKRYSNRLPRISDFEESVCENICDSYEFGNFISYSVIQTGYEDFNFVLTTNSGKYFVKIFSKERKPEDCKRITDLIELLIKSNVHHPKPYKNKSGNYLHEINLGTTFLLLIVMDFIEGKNFFELGQVPNPKQIKQISKDLAHVNSIKIKDEISHIYDNWAIPNLGIEYNKKKKYLKPEENNILNPIIKEFLDTAINSLPKCLVHGDVLKTNVLQDKEGTAWIVDFSVANIYPRILEIAIASTHLLLDISSKENTMKNIALFMKEYEKQIKLNKSEKKALPKFLKFSYAIEYLNTIYEQRVNKNDSKENAFLHEEARIGLSWGDILLNQ